LKKCNIRIILGILFSFLRLGHFRCKKNPK